MPHKRTEARAPRSKIARPRRDPQLVREELLRPCRLLGFDRDQLGCYLINRGALKLAESQFRRAVWLNPYEPSFRAHWALALIKLGRTPEAHDLLQEALGANPQDGAALELWSQNWPDERPPTLTEGAGL